MDSPLLTALLDLCALDSLPRTGWIQAGVSAPESIAGHSHGVALLAAALGPRVEPPLDVARAVTLCVVHDAPEALSGDWPRSASSELPAGVKAKVESRLADRILGDLSDFARTAFAEYQAQATPESRFAKACDRLQMGVRWLAYRRSGSAGLDSFRESLSAQNLDEFPPADALRRELLAAEAAC